MAKKGRTKNRRKKPGQAKAVLPPPWASGLLFTAEELSSNPTLQSFTCYETLMSAAHDKFEDFVKILTELAQACGGRYLENSSRPKQAAALQTGGPDAIVFVGPIKGEARCREKVDSEYNGLWERLLDVLRATVSVREPVRLGHVMRTLRDVVATHGWSVCGPVKNRIERPNADGYRDILLRLRSPDGLGSVSQG